MVQLITNQANLQVDQARTRANQQGVVIAVLDARSIDADVTKSYINQTFSARIIDQLAGNLAKVQTDAAQFWVRLKTPVALGAEVQLRLQGAVSPQLVDAAVVLPLVDVPVSEVDGDAPTQLSSTATLISKVMSSGTQENASLPVSLTLATSVLENDVLVAPPQVAKNLSGAVEKSGVFYESHLNQWAKGERSLESILEEPQNNLGRLLGGREPSSQSVTTTASRLEMTASTLTQGGASSLSPVSSDGVEQVANRLIGVVRDQLQMVDQRQLAMQFEAWPKQIVALTIQEDEPDKHVGTSSGAPVWRVRMNLDLPKLGKVEASLSWHSDQLNVDINTKDSLSQQSMQAARLALMERLNLSGLNVQSIEVKKNE